MASYRLLAVSADSKTVKGEKIGYLTGILYLSPANSSGFELCANRSNGCTAVCLNTAGRGQFASTQNGRLRKTLWLMRDRQGFIAQLRKDIFALIRNASRRNLKPCVRINGTSDLPWLALAMAAEFPTIQFYDYTKHPEPWKRIRSNYALTYSLAEHNAQHALTSLAHGVNVSAVFNVKKGKPLPKTYLGYPVIDGDLTDLRFLDSTGVIVGLRAKGKAKKDCSGFVQQSQFVQIGGTL